MKKFNIFLFLFLSFTFFTGCNSTEDSSVKNEKELKICPQCNMALPKSHIHTCILIKNNKTYYFDDVGCMILWSKDQKIDLKSVETKIFSNDTKKYINTFDAYFMINERTPMLYGFSAYEKEKEGSINFDEVILRMLRGEHMANPKIRKQILGY